MLAGTYDGFQVSRLTVARRSCCMLSGDGAFGSLSIASAMCCRCHVPHALASVGVGARTSGASRGTNNPVPVLVGLADEQAPQHTY